MAWKDLSMSDKSQWMRFFIKNGITDAKQMSEHYNSFAEGGDKDKPNTREVLPYDKAMNMTYYGNKNHGLLPAVNITAKRPSDIPNNDYWQAHSVDRANIQSDIQNAPGWQLAALGAAAPVGFMLGPTIMSALNNPFVDAGLTIQSAITMPNQVKEIKSNFQNGEYGKAALNSGLAAMDIYGSGKFLKGMSNFFNPNIRRQAAYATIHPFSYDDVTERGKDFVKSIYNKDFKRTISVDNLKFRDEAWKTYLGLPNEGMYVKNLDGTYTIDLDKAKKIYEDSERPLATTLYDIQRGRDSFFYNHGGLWGSSIKFNSDKTKGIWTMEDMWDLNPFKKGHDSIGFRIYNGLSNSTWKYDKVSDFFGRQAQKRINHNHGNLLDFELGPVLGGKPFYTKTEVPIEISTGKKGTKWANLTDLSKQDLDDITNNGIEEIYRDASKKKIKINLHN